MGGSAGYGGYVYRAEAVTYVTAHGLAGQPLDWFDVPSGIPTAVAGEATRSRLRCRDRCGILDLRW